MVFYKFSHFIPIGQKKTWSLLVSDWLKLGGTMNCSFLGMMYMYMYGGSCTKCPYFLPVANHTTTCNMAAVLVCDWPIKKNLL